jgi:hypothetical protein
VEKRRRLELDRVRTPLRCLYEKLLLLLLMLMLMLLMMVMLLMLAHLEMILRVEQWGRMRRR